MAKMPLPKAYTSVLASATPELINASIHATAALVLHLVGAQRLSREQRKGHSAILKELLTLLREEDATLP